MLNDKDLRFRVVKGFNHFGLDMLIRSKTHVAELVMKPIEREGISHPNTLEIHDESAQLLMDELWSVGIRPSNGEGNVGQIGAMKAHLEDMRTIAFGDMALNVKKDKL